MDKIKEKSYLIFNSFIIKIIALVTMTLDHIGATMQSFAPYNTTAIEVLRGFGRLAMPLFAFMIVEGVIHSKNIKKYFLRLGILALFISIVLCVFQYVPNGDLNALAGQGNIFLDLLLGALAIYCLSNKKIPIKLLSLLPIAISIMSFCVKGYENTLFNHVLWYPKFLRLQYDWLTIGLIIGFYLANVISPLFLEAFYHVEKGSFDNSKTNRMCINIMSILVIVINMMLYYAVHFMNSSYVFWDYKLQNFAMLSGLILLLYNGLRGYNKKWFQYGCYIYYPLHILLIIGIFVLIYSY